MKGLMKTLPEKILEDGTVIHTYECNACGYAQTIRHEPRQSVRQTGINRCDKCGYEYFYCRLENDLEELMELIEHLTYLTCPNCDVQGFQERLMESYSPLKHEHGKYRMHPITQKHRQT